MKKSLWKRVLALVLCLALSAGYLPVPSFAEEPEEPLALQQEEAEEPTTEPEEETEETREPTTEPTTEPTEESTEAAAETTEAATEAAEATAEPTEAPTEEIPEETTEAPQEELTEEVGEAASFSENEENWVCTVNGTGYASLNDAFAAVWNTEGPVTITMCGNTGKAVMTIECEGECKAQVTLDLAGYQVFMPFSDATTKLNLTVTDSNYTESSAEDASYPDVHLDFEDSANATIDLTLQTGKIGEMSNHSKGKVTINGGVVENLSLDGGSVCEVNGGTVKKLSGDLATVNVAGGTVEEAVFDLHFNMILTGGPYNKVSIVSPYENELNAEQVRTTGTPKGYYYMKADGMIPALEEIDATLKGWHYYTINAVVYVKQHAHVFDEAGKCTCGYIGVAKNGDTLYEVLDEAIDKAQSGDTVVLLQDAEKVDFGSKTITMDLNGYYLATLVGRNPITIKNSAPGDDGTENLGTVSVNMGGGQISLEPGVVAGKVSFGQATLNINGGIVHLVEIVDTGSTIQVNKGRVDTVTGYYSYTMLKGGPYGKLEIRTADHRSADFVLEKIVPGGYQFLVEETSTIITAGDVKESTTENGEYLYTISGPVRVHAHDFGTDGSCSCGMISEAKIGNTYYPTLKKAFEGAASGSIITLLADMKEESKKVTSSQYYGGAALTLDLNGRKLFGLEFTNFASEPKLTITDSSDGATGEIGEVEMQMHGQVCVTGGTLKKFSSSLYTPIIVSGGTVEAVYLLTPDSTMTVSGGTVKDVHLGSNSPVMTVEDGTVENVNMESGTLTHNGGTVKNVILTAGTYKCTLSGGPFEKLQITSDSALDSIDLTQFAPEDQNFYFTTGKLVRAGNIVHTEEDGKHIYTISGPVEVKAHTHSFNENTHECSCGEFDVEAKFNGTFYATLAEAVEAFQSAHKGTIVLLKDLDTIQMTYTGTYVPVLDLNGHTVNTLVANSNINVKNNSQGPVTISSIQISDKRYVWVYSNVTVENVTLDGGSIINKEGTVRKVTIIKSSKETALVGGPFGEVYIQSTVSLTELNLSTFADGDCLQKNGTAVSAAAVRGSEKEQEDGSYVYSLGGPITVSEDHSFDPDTGICPCGVVGLVKVGDKIYDSMRTAVANIPEGAAITLLRDVTEDVLSVRGNHNTFDWNGHTLTVEEGSLYLDGTATLTDNSDQGNGGVSGIVNISSGSNITIAGGRYSRVDVGWKNSTVQLTGGYFCNIRNSAQLDLLPEGYAMQRYGNKLTRATVESDYSEIGDVTVIKCEDHTYGSDGKCKYCLSAALASVRDGDQEDSYYDTLEAALAAAGKITNPIIGLLKDVEGGTYDLPEGAVLGFCGERKMQGTLRVSSQKEDSQVRLEAGEDAVAVSKIEVSGSANLAISGPFKIDSLLLNGDGHVLYGGESIQSVTMEGGTLCSYGTVESLTLTASDKLPKLEYPESAEDAKFNSVRIVSAAKLNALNLSAFVVNGNCLTKNGKPISAAEVLKNGDQGAGETWVYSLDGPVTISKTHTFDPTTGICPCGYQAEAKIGNTFYATLEEAFDAVQDNETIVLLADLDEQVNTSVNKTLTLDLNGKKFTDINADGAFKLTVRDSQDGPNIAARGSIFSDNGDAQVTIQSGKIVGVNMMLNGGTFRMSGGELGTFDTSGGTHEITGGSITSGATLRYDATLTVSGGTVQGVNFYRSSGTLTVTAGTVKNVTMNGKATLTHSGGTVECVTFVAENTEENKISGGPFGKLRVSSEKTLSTASIDLTQYIPDGTTLIFQDYKEVTTADFVEEYDSETRYYYYIVTGPVIVHTHDFDKDTGLCPCGVQAEAKVGSTVYETFEEALEAFNNSTQSSPHLSLLKDVDLSGKNLTITRGDDHIFWNGHTLTVASLSIDAHDITMHDTGTGGVTGTITMGHCNQLEIDNGTYSNLWVRNGCTIYDGTYGCLVMLQDCSSITINGGTFDKMEMLGTTKVNIPSGKMFYRGNQVWTEGLSGQIFNLTLKPHDPHTPDETTGVCICGLTFAASVTAGDKTTYYATLQEAITEAAKTSGTVKLARDLDTATLSSGTFTLDWNGHSVTALAVTGGTLTLTGTGGVTGTAEKALDIQGGTVTIQSGSYNNVSVSETANVTVAGGSFAGKDGQKPITAADMSKVQFAVGKAVHVNDGYYPTNRSDLSFDADQSLTVKDCNRHSANGENICNYCAAQLVAYVNANGVFTYYATFEDALAKAQEEEGSTLYLLRDVELGSTKEQKVETGSFTIDWNGYSIKNLRLRIWFASKTSATSNITLKSTQEGGGMADSSNWLRIDAAYGTVTIENGSYYGTAVTTGTGLTIRGGTFTRGENDPPIIISSSKLFTVPDGYVFYDQDKNVVSDWRTKGFAEGSTVTCKLHENHAPDDNGHCVCGYTLAAMRMEWDSYDGKYVERPYEDFQTAFADAKQKGGTLILWKDVTLSDGDSLTASSTDQPFTLDWNGRTISGGTGLVIDTIYMTLKDSKGTGGLGMPLTINGEGLTIQGGTYHGVTLTGSGETTVTGGTFYAANGTPIAVGEATVTLTGDKAFHNSEGTVITQENALAVSEGYVYVASHDHQKNKCPCGRSFAATVTVDGVSQDFSDIQEAFNKVSESSGSITVKLLSNGTLENGFSLPSTFTLDLGGCTLDLKDNQLSPQGTFVIQDSGEGGKLVTGGINSSYYSDMRLEGGEIVGNIENGGKLTIQGGKVSGNVSGNYSTITISAGIVTGEVSGFGNTLTITGGTIGTLGRNNAGTTTLHGGTFGKLDGCDRYMLEEGWALYDANGKVVNIGGENVANVTIKVHTHDFSKGTCPCGGITSGEGLDLLKPDDYETLQMLGYQVNGEEVQLQPRTWGGKEYLSRYDGEPLKNAILQTYSWEYNANNDRYPTGTTVYRVVEVDHHLELVEETKLENLLEYIGVSIRCAGETGIRISTGMTKANKTALTGEGLDGFKLVKYGTVAAWSGYLGEDGSLVLGKKYCNSGCAYNRDTNLDKVFKDRGTAIEYTNVLVNYPINYCCGLPIAFRPFAVLEREDGTQFTIYGGQIERTIAGIAQQVLDDTTVVLTDAQRAYVQSLVNAAKGDNNG